MEVPSMSAAIVDHSLAWCPDHPERTPIVVADGRGFCARCALIKCRVNVPPELRADADDDLMDRTAALVARLRADVALVKGH
jgi:hypothetical protein